jgi:hypothetical protein
MATSFFQKLPLAQIIFKRFYRFPSAYIYKAIGIFCNKNFFSKRILNVQALEKYSRKEICLCENIQYFKPLVQCL